MAYRFIKNTFGLFVYYMLLFAVCRLIFLVYFFNIVTKESTGVLFQSLWQAIPLDVSAASYLLIIPVLLLLCGSYLSNNIYGTLLKSYLVVTTVAIVLLSTAEIGVYREVHVKVYFNLLTHLLHFTELFRSISYSLLFAILGLFAFVTMVAVTSVNKFYTLQRQGKAVTSESIKLLLAFLVTGILLALGCRGGLQPIPINEGQVVFCNNQCVNDGTINPLWSLVHSYIENRDVRAGNVYHVMPDNDATEIVSQLFTTDTSSSLSILKISRPNICILILESWSADLVESCGGYEGLTPNFEKLVKQGYLFTNAVSAGHVSDQGIPAILSGYPALPIGSVINQPGKSLRLPGINTQLKKQGYYSTFFFGGQLIYGNIKSFIYQNKFDRVLEQESFPGDLPAGRLGISDSLMLNIWLDSLNTFKQPFFSSLFTLSTHSPYDAGRDNKIDWGGMEKNYLNSVVYADRQLGLFFSKASKQPWYGNTVFILIADHSHNTPQNHYYDSPLYYHIPWMICGAALKNEYWGKKDNRIVSQNDVAATLLGQLQIPASEYPWSKNVFCKSYKPFAFYTFNEGFGFIDTTGYFVWNKKEGKTKSSDTAMSVQLPLKQKGSAFLQQLMKNFSER